MRLYLVQHGEARPKEVDPERALTEGGRADVERLSVFLKGSGIKVNRVIHSGKLRAQQTAEILCQALCEEGVLERTDMIGPTDAPEPFASEIGELNSDTMVVGHLPFMARLVSLFVIGNTEHPVTAYQPGTAVCLERQLEGAWTIAWMLRPGLLSR